MRKAMSLDALFPKTRQAILGAMLIDPARSWYLSDLARHLGVTPSSLQRELHSLARGGILRRNADGNRVYFRTDPDCPFLSELRGIILKTVGLGNVLQECLDPLRDRIRVAFVYGSMARSEERSASDVDLMVIGSVGLSQIAPVLKKAEVSLGRAVNPSVYSAKEVVKKLSAGHHFLETILKGEKIYIQGDQSDLEAALGE
jgi:predicted nucleotidyltransferase